MSEPCRAKKRPRWVEIPTERVQIEEPLHRADWPRRAEVVPAFTERVAKVQSKGQWMGKPIRVRRQGDDYTLISGFSRLAIAVEAGLPTVRAVVEPATQEIPLEEIHLRPWQEKARLNPDKLAQRLEVAQKSGSLPVPLDVRPAQAEEPAGYTLLDGLYWYHIARELALERVPAIVRG